MAKAQPAHAAPPALCRLAYGRGLGGVRRACCRLHGHGRGVRCSDMPFLDNLLRDHPKVADKIQRDSFQTRGASWGRNKKGEMKRLNRQPRWTLAEGHALYPAQYQTYENCLIIAAELALQAYEMRGAPPCPSAIARLLPRAPKRNIGTCLICGAPLLFSEFSLAERSKAAIDTDHLNPRLRQRHVSGNVAFVHHLCNTTKGDRSLEEFMGWMQLAMRRHGYTVTKPS